jgi:UDP-N-acetylbacillosamine N-acetyltransferase
MKSIYIYGASGHGLVVEDIARACGYQEILFIDDNHVKYPKFSDFDVKNEIPIVIGIGDNKIRADIFDKIEKFGMKIITLIHPSAVISKSAIIDKGTVIMPNVIVNAYTKIGMGCIINSGAVIEHENNIHNFVHVSPNASLAGNVSILDSAHIGIAAVVRQEIKIGEHTLIGAGSVVVQNIPSFSVAYGNPCKVKGAINV